MYKVDGETLYKRVKYNSPKYQEELHCPLIFKVMADPKKGTISAFCMEANISDHKFYKWIHENELFEECYRIARMYAREIWEAWGREISEELTMPGTANHKFEHWKMIGWSRFGVGKNSRIRLNLNPEDAPNKHYGQLLKQASDGDFTAGEIKQLMEAVNVGLNTHQVFALQSEIDQLKFDLGIMNENTSGNNTFADKRTT